jgi:hypothetical protein
VLRLHYDLASVERGPVPPHERTWRHPSELAAEQRSALRAQSAAPSTRVFALTTGTLGLLAVGVLILTVTPRRLDAPIAISASTTPATAPVNTPNRSDAARPAALAPAFAGRGAVTTDLVSIQQALATPIGDGRLAVITEDAVIADHGDRIEVRLASGQSGSGLVIGKSGDTWLIALDQANGTGHEIASERPTSSEIVTVMNSPPVTIELAEIATLDIDEGTAVLDSDGDLVGICTRRNNGEVRLIEVRAELVDATSDVP